MTIINPLEFNIWRNGQGFTNSIIALNSEDIDYSKWTDIDIYIWHVNHYEHEAAH